VEFPADDGLRDILGSLALTPEQYLGHGGEAWVYALDDERIVRVLHENQHPDTIRHRQALVEELGARGAPFALPELLEVGERDGRWFTIERRLPGISVAQQLGRLDGNQRDLLVEHHLEAAARLGTLPLTPRGWFGDLLAEAPVRATTWRGYLRERAATSVANSTREFATVDAQALADALPDTPTASFVHLDAFAGNMLARDTTITAVLDFGATSASGDARLDPLSVAVYLAAPQITPVSTPRDVDVAMSWLRSASLAQWYEPARRWLAAFWSFAIDDRQLHQWCRSVLLTP
jgi:phage gp46-like protein